MQKCYLSDWYYPYMTYCVSYGCRFAYVIKRMPDTNDFFADDTNTSKEGAEQH